MTASGRRSERSGAGVKHLTRIGPGRLVCQVRINGRDRVTLTMRVDDQGSLALHKLQESAKNPIRSPWFSRVDARRPKRLDANARPPLRAACSSFQGSAERHALTA